MNRIRFLLVNTFSSLAEICFQEFPLSEIFLLFGLMLDLLDLTSGSIIVWTETSGNVPSDLCARRSFRSACSFAQSDQNLQWGQFKVSSCGQRRLWSDCAHAQANLSLRWAHTSGGTISYVAVRMRLFVSLTCLVPIWQAEICNSGCVRLRPIPISRRTFNLEHSLG